MIATILLVPVDDWRDRLLGDGPCGSRPPTLLGHIHKDGGRCWDPVCGRARWLDGFPDGRRDDHALVIARDGAVVRDGRDRAAYCLSAAEKQACVDGVRWREGVTIGGDPTFCLHGDDSRFTTYARRGWYSVAFPWLAAAPLRTVHALAVVYVTRGLGTAVLLDSEDREVKP